MRNNRSNIYCVGVELYFGKVCMTYLLRAQFCMMKKVLCGHMQFKCNFNLVAITYGPRSRWVDNIKMDLVDDGMVWTGLVWLRIGTSGELL
jgi:hypothetical protein